MRHHRSGTAATDPEALGRWLEAVPDPAERSRRGVWFTPPDVADRLVTEGLDRLGWLAQPPIVLDPAVGAGSFLLAAHRQRPDARLRGVDIDELSIRVAHQALAADGADDVDLVVGDGLDPTVTGSADLVVANPPFLSQLSAATGRSHDRRRWLREVYGPAADAYVDDAALFLLSAVTSVLSHGGVTVMVLPESVLATAAAAEVRRRVSARGAVEVVWRDTDRVFPGVPTCALAITVDDRPWATGWDWGHLLADGIPDLTPTTARSIGDLATASADFREAYYTVAAHAVEGHAGEDAPKITPVGLIDPAHNRWGTTRVRFAKQRFTWPVAKGLDPGFLAGYAGPKLLVATQTKVLEAVVDAEGDWLPTTPVITVRSEQPWHVGAALTNPIATAVAARRHAGAARSRSAIKLSARQLLALPVPHGDSSAWDAAADDFAAAHRTGDPDRRRHHLDRCGQAMWDAYGIPTDRDAHGWWLDRLPSR